MELIPGSLNNSFGYNFNNFGAINNNLSGFANLNANNAFPFTSGSVSGPVQTHSITSVESFPVSDSDQFVYSYEPMSANPPTSSVSIPTSGSTNMPVISLFKLKSFLTKPKFASTKVTSDGNFNSTLSSLSLLLSRFFSLPTQFSSLP
jgi:hypothetical protein